ncbi:MAG TPA: hypothetical protein VFR80_00040 [Pyrinomonadaceae bacterium]|nr:hypothetical protein [Pyrinomonadaceae bacterium]
MQDKKQQRAEKKKSTAELKAERQSDATDDEVLREEETGRSSSGAKGKDSSPSPDGAFDEREEREKADPV